MEKEKRKDNNNESGKEKLQRRNRIESDEKKAERLRKDRERQQQKRLNETRGEREIRLAKRRDAYKKKAEENRGEQSDNKRKSRQQESAEERESRLQGLRRRSQEILQSETPQERSSRLDVKRRRTAEIIESETQEERAERLEVVRRDTAARIQSETPDQRAERLEVLRQNADERIQSETQEERAERLEILRRNAAERVASETAEERETRCVSMRTNLAERIEKESVSEREERLEIARKSASERRANNVSFQQEHMPVDSREEYLHQGGWEDDENPLHEQEWVRDEMGSFHSSQEILEHRQCNICKETWPTKQNLSKDPASYVCNRCKRDKKSPKVYSAENDMDPGIVPQQLEGLTQIEEMLIARVCPIMSVYRKHGGQRGYKGHVLNLPQDIQSFLNRLPSRVPDLPVLVVRRHGVENTHRDFTVRQHRVLEAVLWLTTNNPYFKDVEIAREAINCLPANGIPNGLRFVDDTDVSPHEDEDEGPPQEPVNTEVDDNGVEESVLGGARTSFIPQRQKQRKEQDAIRQTVNNEEPLDWPTTEADSYWPESQRLLQNDDDATRSERGQAVIDNPHLTDWYFKQRLDEFIRHWLHGVLDADWHWFRFEYQARGSIHAHGCAKLKNDPDIPTLRAHAAKAWSLIETESREEDFEFFFQHVDHGKEAEKQVLRYIDWLVTTFNDDLPDEQWRVPQPHPCGIKPSVVEDSDADYHRLVNTVERHTRCSSAYCLRQKHLGVPAECRFGFPKGLEEETHFNYELLSHRKIGVELVTKRNDHRLNSHNRVMLENWRANVDLQVIINKNACARYMAKYAAKGEPCSKQASEILGSCMSRLQDNDQVSSAIKKAMIQIAGDRDMAAQETAHMLLSMPLTGCTYGFVTVCLDNSRKVVIDNENQTDEVLQKSTIEEYGKRSTVNSTYGGLSQLNLMQYVSQYTKVRAQVRKRAVPYVVRTFPKVSGNPQGPDFGRYCKYQLIKFKPWEGEPSNAWGNKEESDELFINTYELFLTTDFAEDNVIDHDQEASRVFARQSGQDEESEDGDDTNESDDEHNDQPEETDEWMLLCRLNQHYEQSDNPLLDDETDWFEEAKSVPMDLLKECPGWISKQRKDAEERGRQPLTAQPHDGQPAMDPAT